MVSCQSFLSDVRLLINSTITLSVANAAGWEKIYFFLLKVLVFCYTIPIDIKVLKCNNNWGWLIIRRKGIAMSEKNNNNREEFIDIYEQLLKEYADKDTAMNDGSSKTVKIDNTSEQAKYGVPDRNGNNNNKRVVRVIFAIPNINNINKHPIKFPEITIEDIK